MTRKEFENKRMRCLDVLSLCLSILAVTLLTVLICLIAVQSEAQLSHWIINQKNALLYIAGVGTLLIGFLIVVVIAVIWMLRASARRNQAEQGAQYEQSWSEEIALELNLTAGLVVAVDPERLRRAFINVFSNAVQSFTGEKRGDETLSITLLPAGKRVQLVVMDNGSGISDEVMPRIFEPMFSTKNFGVGLGMAIVQNIMEEQGGGGRSPVNPEKGLQ